MAMHVMTRGQAPKFLTLRGNEEEVEDVDLNSDHHMLSLIMPDGSIRGAGDPTAQTSFINSNTVNILLSTPGTRMCFDINMHIVQARPNRAKKVGEPASIVLGMMLAGMLGMTARPVFLGSATTRRAATLGTSKAAKAFTRRTWAITKRFLSRIGTGSFTRAHTKGGYMIDRTDVLDSSRSLPAMARGQKHRD